MDCNVHESTRTAPERLPPPTPRPHRLLLPLYSYCQIIEQPAFYVSTKKLVGDKRFTIFHIYALPPTYPPVYWRMLLLIGLSGGPCISNVV